MFERLRKAWLRLHWSSAQREPLAQWAQTHGFVFAPQVQGAYALSGNWSGKAVRIECMAASRPFMKGMELMARADLGLPGAGGVVLMNRVLKLHLEQWASELYSQYTDTLQTTAHALPDEVRWLAMYRDAGWSGPDSHFWARYAVLTDAPDRARQWLDSDGLRRLMRWPSDAVTEETPLMLMVMRGKAYMRLQIDQPRDVATALHALDLFHHFSERARQVLPPR